MPYPVGIAPAAACPTLCLIGLLPTSGTQTVGIAPVQLRTAVIEMLVNTGALSSTALGKRQKWCLTRKKATAFEALRLCTRLPAGLDGYRMKRVRRIQNIGHRVAAAPHQAIGKKKNKEYEENRGKFVHDMHHGQHTACT